MNHPHTATTDPYAFSLWPDAAASSEETRLWAQTARYAQTGFTGDNFSFDGLDATAAWGQSATLPAAAYGLENISGSDWTSGGMVPAGDVLGHGVSLAGAAATDTMAFAPAPTPPFPTDGLDAFTQDFFSPQSPQDSSNSLSSTPPLTDGSSVPSPQSEGTGDGIIPFPTFGGASSYFVQPSGPSTSQLDITRALQPDQFTWASPSWFMGDGNLAGQLPLGYLPTLDPMNMNGTMSYPMELGYNQTHDHITAPAEALTMMVTGEMVASSSLGKRIRNEENGSGPQKRARQDATRVPGGTESGKRTHHSPATRTQQQINDKSKAVGRGAGRLAYTTTQGVYHRSLPGHSAPQGSAGALEQEQPPWIEEREVETRHDTGSSVPQQIVQQSVGNAEDGEDLHEFPRNLSVRERLMLQTTQTDEERGAVRVIKCKLCPKPRFSTWETFRRHCKSCEKHPSGLRFCPKCGDYFGRPDSGVRHRKDKKYQKACLETSQDEASEKKQKVERLLKEFEARLEHCLKNGEEIGPRFSDIVNKKLTNTSKKVSKQEEIWSEGDSWAAGL